MLIHGQQNIIMLYVCVYSVVSQTNSQGLVPRGREAEHRPSSAAALSLCGEQRKEFQRHQRLHAGHPAQRYRSHRMCVCCSIMFQLQVGDVGHVSEEHEGGGSTHINQS